MFYYALFGGHHPFKTPEFTRQHGAETEKIYFDTDKLNRYKNVADLLRSMFEKDPKNRSSATQVYQHEFFKFTAILSRFRRREESKLQLEFRIAGRCFFTLPISESTKRWHGSFNTVVISEPVEGSIKI